MLLREWGLQEGVEFECFINEKCMGDGLKTFAECAAKRVTCYVKVVANENEK
ncbi:TPA: hypothetical protein U2L31_007607 [Burkholderia contaminans]|uniref:hypothetical protein n=1 Tax=Burkholderia contaminans TaxID=488447 RepID=UPI001583B573|nr:hypothetical protein [Burkholderia contaminans]HEM7881121.1 hypothetical protein [Burkholderia contaminans]